MIGESILFRQRAGCFKWSMRSRPSRCEAQGTIIAMTVPWLTWAAPHTCPHVVLAARFHSSGRAHVGGRGHGCGEASHITPAGEAWQAGRLDSVGTPVAASVPLHLRLLPC
jgi:hypothetical protein